MTTLLKESNLAYIGSEEDLALKKVSEARLIQESAYFKKRFFLSSSLNHHTIGCCRN